MAKANLVQASEKHGKKSTQFRRINGKFNKL